MQTRISKPAVVPEPAGDAKIVIPKRGIRFSDFEPIPATKTASTAGGAHEVKVRYFTDLDGKRKKCFFKALNNVEGPTYYPRLLAMLSVLASLYCRLMLGDNAAEDRLVFDDQGNIIGTCSVELEGFCPLLLNTGPEPTDPELREKQIPSTETLLKNRTLEILFASYIFANDDLHPENLSLHHLIDFDEFFPFNKKIKDERPVSNWLKAPLSLSMTYVNKKELDNFPVITQATHAPTHNIPGNLNYIKAYRGYQQFINLAANPYIIENGKTITAQDQLAIAKLKFLLTKQPEVLRQRLKDYFGELPLHFLTLPDKKVQGLPEKRAQALNMMAPNFFNNETNTQPFAQFGENYYNFIYDNVYRNVVFSTECEKNDYGVRVPSFMEQLLQNPSLYQEVEKWIEAENKKMQNMGKPDSFKGKVSLNPVSPSHLFKPAQNAPLYKNMAMSKKIAPASPPILQMKEAPCDGWQFNLEKVRSRYHKIFRDSFSLKLHGLWKKSVMEVKILIEKLKSEDPVFVTFQEISASDPNLTESRELFGNPVFKNMEVIQQTLPCDQDHEHRIAAIKMIKLLKDWVECADTYYRKRSDELTQKDSNDFEGIMRDLCNRYLTDIHPHLGEYVSAGANLNNYMRELKDLGINMSFTTHMDNQNGRVHYLNTRIDRENYLEPKVITRCMNGLFDWINSMNPQEIKKYFDMAITNYKRQTWMNNRAAEVQKYVELSENESPGNRLAHILSEDPNHIKGAMNVEVIRVLLVALSESPVYRRKSEFKVIWDALQSTDFDIEAYTVAAIQHCKAYTSMEESNYRKINKWLLKEVDEAYSDNVSSFKDMLIEMENSYAKQKEKTLFGFGSYIKTARSIFTEINEDQTPSAILTGIFAQGGWKQRTKMVSESLNVKIYNKLLELSIYSCANNAQKNRDPGYILAKGIKEDTEFKLCHDDMRKWVSAQTRTLVTSSSGITMKA